MELIEIEQSLADLEPAQRQVAFAHGSTFLHRGLEQGEEIVVRLGDGELHAAEVIGVEFSLEDTHYTARVGVRLPEDQAAHRLGAALIPKPRVAAEGTSLLNMQDVLDLLGHLRGRAN